MRNVSSLEAIHRDFADKDVNFFYIYKRLAHPGMNGYVDPFTVKERLAHIQEAKRNLGTEIPWICDNMQDELKTALGGAPNSEFVIDPDGKIVRMRDWSNPTELRRDLSELVGNVEGPRVGTFSQQPLANRNPQRSTYATGVVPWLEVPPGMQRLRIEAVDETQLFFAKLEAFGEKTVMSAGDGAIHLSFKLDRIHHVHWNNLAAPIEYEIKGGQSGDGVSDDWLGEISPDHGKGPKVEVDSDTDPREFLVYLCGIDVDQPLHLTVRYFACSDEQGWCRPMTQSYRIYLESAGDMRRRMDFGGGRRGFGGGRFFGFGR